MNSNLAVDMGLLNQAVQIGGLDNENDTVTLALREFIHHRKAENLIDAFGTVDFDETYDYKTGRDRNV
ncbi:MAG: type II toxin-antitoxin system VapB family antitoxin [Lachnospiraceae bacterium]|nr:type II toxin-antitoxin system VapB family antitoxin [Lachnospiraceae bacterium]